MIILPEERVLDWTSTHDPRSKNYAVRSILPAPVQRRPVFWKEGPVLNQGREGACVGYGWTAELLAEPFTPSPNPTVAAAQDYATLAYRRAQKIDDIPGENYEGTSVLAGAKIMQEDGQIGSYRWCFGSWDIRDCIISYGPVVIGIPWYSGMYRTTRNGVVTVEGDHVGGHCLVVTGYDPSYVVNGKAQEVFRWRNSWGTSYGINGSGIIKYRDLTALLLQGGEACVPEGRNTPKFDISLD
jgi:hypothetical protein